MTDSTYKIIEIVGTSSDSLAAAIDNGVGTLGKVCAISIGSRSSRSGAGSRKMGARSSRSG